jgi:hypothetical protein
MKKCTKCKEKKELSEFRKGSTIDGYKTQCKICCKEIDKLYRKNNRDKVLNASKKYDDSNRLELNRKARERYVIDKPSKIAYSIKYQNERYKKDAFYATKHKLRTRLQSAFRVSSWYKNTGTTKMLGCNYEVAFNHIEKQFIKGMNWENRTLWHIDHIIPLASAKTEEELIKLCHYTNLQPLWAEDNLKKGSKIL